MSEQSNTYTRDDIPTLERKWKYNEIVLRRIIDTIANLEMHIDRATDSNRRTYLLGRWRYNLNRKTEIDGYQRNIENALIDLNAPGWVSK